MIPEIIAKLIISEKKKKDGSFVEATHPICPPQIRFS